MHKQNTSTVDSMYLKYYHLKVSSNIKQYNFDLSPIF